MPDGPCQGNGIKKRQVNVNWGGRCEVQPSAPAHLDRTARTKPPPLAPTDGARRGERLSPAGKNAAKFNKNKDG
jgi:hypothetical protein